MEAAMLIEIALGLMLAPGGAKPERVAIYVGPIIRDGFVDADEGVLREIKTVQRRLKQDPNDKQKDTAFRVVPNEAEATVRLYIVACDKTTTEGGIGATSPVKCWTSVRVARS